MQSVQFIIIKSFVWFLRLLPALPALYVGKCLGLLMYCVDRKHRCLVYQNLKYAFIQERSLGEIRGITRKFFMNLSMNFIEFLRQPLLDPEKFEEIIEFDGIEHIDEAFQKNCGVVAMTMHCGNWEFSTLGLSLTGHAQAIIFKAQENASAFNRVMVSCRKDTYKKFHNIHLYEKAFGAGRLVRALRNNEMAGMLIDQAGKDGVPMQFFGRNSSFSVGGVRMAMKMGAPICIGSMVRQKGLKHKLYVKKFEWEKYSEEEDENFLLNVQKIANIFEEIIRENPEQYMWMYKVWKFDQSKNIMILDDNRVGHLRQSQAVSRIIGKEVRQRDSRITEKIVSVKYKNKAGKVYVSLCALIKGLLPASLRLKILKVALIQESYDGLCGMKADIVISAGSYTAPVNCLIADEHNAKSACLLRPSILPWKMFDLLILPGHDKPAHLKASRQLVFTKGAPNLIDDDYLQLYADSLQQRYSHLKFRDKFKIGVLLGGDTKDYIFDEAQAKILVHQIKEVAEQLDADIMITTSRRTSEKVENLFSREFKKYPRCPLLIIANRSNVPEAVGGILAVSDVLVVTGDSVSMVSEAASSGKKTVVVPIKKRNESADYHKHNRFVDGLSADGYILCAALRTLKTSIFDLAKNKICTRKLDDSAILQKSVSKLL